jgi:hypothetical protein
VTVVDFLSPTSQFEVVGTEDEKMDEKVEVTCFVAMNESGEYVVVTDEDDALSELGAQQGGNFGRVVKVTLMMAPPEVVEVKGEVPDDAGTVGELTVATE